MKTVTIRDRYGDPLEVSSAARCLYFRAYIGDDEVLYSFRREHARALRKLLKRFLRESKGADD